MQEHNLSQSRPTKESEQGALSIHLLYIPEVVKDFWVINLEQQIKRNIYRDLKE